MSKRRRSKRWIWWLVMLVLLVAASVVVYFVWDNYLNDKKEETAEVETTEIEQENTNEEIQTEEEIIEAKKVAQYDGESPNTTEELSGVLTYTEVQDSKLIIRINIDQYLESGKCELALQKNGNTVYNNTANIVENASTSTCEGFDIPVGELGGGKINININLEANGKKGTICGEVNI